MRINTTRKNQIMLELNLGRAIQREIIGSSVDGLDNADVAHAERGFAVAQIVIPFANESVVESERSHFAQVFVEPLSPYLQCACIRFIHACEIVEE